MIKLPIDNALSGSSLDTAQLGIITDYKSTEDSFRPERQTHLLYLTSLWLELMHDRFASITIHLELMCLLMLVITQLQNVASTTGSKNYFPLKLPDIQYINLRPFWIILLLTTLLNFSSLLFLSHVYSLTHFYWLDVDLLNFCLTNDDDDLNFFLILFTKNTYGISGEVLLLPVQ